MARLQGGTIHNPRTEYSPVLSDPKGMILLYGSNLVGENGRGGGGGGGRKEKEKERRKRKKVRAGVAGEARTRAPSLVKTAL